MIITADKYFYLFAISLFVEISETLFTLKQITKE